MAADVAKRRLRRPVGATLQLMITKINPPAVAIGASHSRGRCCLAAGIEDVFESDGAQGARTNEISQLTEDVGHRWMVEMS